MRGTLTFCAIMCLLVWGGKKGWEYHKAHQTSLEAAEWKITTGDYPGSIPLLVKAQQEDPNNIMIVLKLADSLQRTGERAQAMRLYRQAEPYMNDPKLGEQLGYYRDRMMLLRNMGL
jgi:Tfp pilus assembly protein PilF